MDLVKLFEMQDVLDERIKKEKGLEGQDLLQEKILALNTELGELANEWRGFKFWSEVQKSRTKKRHYAHCHVCDGRGEDPLDSMEICSHCEGDGKLLKKITNPLLEEYVDCLHFILSIGLGLRLHLDLEEMEIDSDYTEERATETFNKMFSCISELKETASTGAREDLIEIYEITFNLFIGIGEKHLGFNIYQINQAYFEKNEINHQRQENGY